MKRTPQEISRALWNYNPPDRTIDEQRQIAVDIYHAAETIDTLIAENKELDDLNYVQAGMIAEMQTENSRLEDFIEGLDVTVHSPEIATDKQVVEILEQQFRAWRSDAEIQSQPDCGDLWHSEPCDVCDSVAKRQQSTVTDLQT